MAEKDLWTKIGILYQCAMVKKKSLATTKSFEVIIDPSDITQSELLII